MPNDPCACLTWCRLPEDGADITFDGHHPLCDEAIFDGPCLVYDTLEDPEAPEDMDIPEHLALSSAAMKAASITALVWGQPVVRFLKSEDSTLILAVTY